MSANTMDYTAWLDAFKQEHGWLPWEDPGLLALGFTPEEALQEHLTAKQTMEAAVQATGQPLGQNPQNWQALWHARWDNPNYELPSWGSLGTSLGQVVAAGTQSKKKETQYSALQMAQEYGIDLSPFLGTPAGKTKKTGTQPMTLTNAQQDFTTAAMATGLIANPDQDIPYAINILADNPNEKKKYVAGVDANGNPIIKDMSDEMYNAYADLSVVLATAYTAALNSGSTQYANDILDYAMDFLGHGIEKNRSNIAAYGQVLVNIANNNAAAFAQQYANLLPPQSTAGATTQAAPAAGGGSVAGATTQAAPAAGGGSVAGATMQAAPAIGGGPSIGAGASSAPAAGGGSAAGMGTSATIGPGPSPTPAMVMVALPNGNIGFLPATEVQAMLEQQSLGYPPIIPQGGQYYLAIDDRGNVHFLSPQEYQQWLARNRGKRK